MKKISTILFLLLLSACTLPGRMALPASLQSPPAISSSETPANEVQCAFLEGRQSLPDISSQLNKKLTAANLPVKSTRAEAYGENCISAEGVLVRFSARETDYYIALTVTDLKDEADLGFMLEKILNTIEQFPIEQTPGPNPGYISVSFETATETRNLWFTRKQAVDLIAQNISGAQLYRGLAGTP